MAIQLEVGKTYRRADGVSATVVAIIGTNAYMVVTADAGGTVESVAYHGDGSPIPLWLTDNYRIDAEWSAEDLRVRCNMGEHSLVDTGGRHSWCRVCDLDFELVAWEWVPTNKRRKPT